VSALFLGCGDATQKLTVVNSSWPDGASVALISEDGILSETSLYGERATLSLPASGTCFLRAASPDYIVFVSDTLFFDSDDIANDPASAFHLPAPVARKTIGAHSLTLAFAPDMADTLYMRMLGNTAGHITTMVTPLISLPSLPHIVKAAHVHGVEITARTQLSDTVSSKTLLDSVIVAGIDGFVILAERTETESDEWYRTMRTFCGSVHKYGMTCALRIETDCRSGSYSPSEGLIDLMTQMPRPERPDEIVVSFQCSGLTHLPAAETMAPTLLGIESSRLPLHVVSVEIVVTALKFNVGDDGVLEKMPLARGELDRLIRAYDGKGQVRLPDGTLRIGDRGALYVYNDCESVAQTVRELINNGFARIGGFHILYDGFGMHPDAEDFVVIAESIAGGGR
jgi:hypothetical protein